MRESAFAVAIGGKADLPLCYAHVRFWPKADILPWRESEVLPKIEHAVNRRRRATCSDAVKAKSR